MNQLAVAFILFSFTLFSQGTDTVTHLQNKDGITVYDDLILFSDSSYVLSLWSDTYRLFSLGHYSKGADTITLFPHEKIKKPAVRFRNCTSNESKNIEVNFVNHHNDTIDLSWQLLEPEMCLKLLQSDRPYNWNYEKEIWDSSALIVHETAKYMVFEFERKEYQNYDLVCLGAKGFFLELPIIEVEPEYCIVDIEVPIPQNLIFFAQLKGALEYYVPKNETILIGNRQIKIKSP